MYLTGGQFKGRKIKVPDNVRPTLSKTRQAVFNILAQFDLENGYFLDMFAGSGLIGLEAVSRGYNVLELELNSKNVDIIKNNYSSLSLKANVICADSLKYKSNIKFEIIYIDPPWGYDYVPILIKAINLLEKNGIIILEYDKNNDISLEKIIEKNNLNIEIFKLKNYGRSSIAFLK